MAKDRQRSRLDREMSVQNKRRQAKATKISTLLTLNDFLALHKYILQAYKDTRYFGVYSQYASPPNTALCCLLNETGQWSSKIKIKNSKTRKCEMRRNALQQTIQILIQLYCNVLSCPLLSLPNRPSPWHPCNCRRSSISAALLLMVMSFGHGSVCT